MIVRSKNGNARIVRAIAEGSPKTITRDVPRINTMVVKKPSINIKVPVDAGKFGRFGGKYVPETVISLLSKLEAEFYSVLQDDEFQEELATTLRDYVGRETPLYFAPRLTDHYRNNDGEGPEIYLEREDLNHCGAHKLNNAIVQAMIAKRMKLKSLS